MMKFLTITLISLAALLAAAACLYSDATDPLAVSNKALGGGEFNQYTPGITDGTGLNNIGLLVRTSGWVTYVDAFNQIFYINDGSGVDDQSGCGLGIRVSYKDLAPGNTFSPPSTGKFVLVTGISSTSEIEISPTETRIIPTLRPRRQDDMQDVTPLF